ncbi:MAG: DUF192 domain-containing protein [Candidatus Kaiserbacteria bacterium]|nr:DUF192 domain-containing protein [Candidatus Kaiserbacteria bacterium]
MPRYFYIGLLVLLTVVAAVLFAYRTIPATPSPAIAEFGGVSLRIEYATTTAMQEKGLGGRASIPNDYGMLFVFQKDDKYGFWMKGMLVPIDIFWLNDKRQVVSITQNAAPSSYPNVFYPTESARYVLETTTGFASEHNITIGAFLLLKNFEHVSE